MTVLDDQQGGTTSSTTQAAKDEASGVASRAKDAAGGVAQTTTEQAKEVAGEAKRQARDLADQARSRVSSQAGEQRQKAVSSLRSLGDELGQMAEGSSSSGLGAEIARQASTRVNDVAHFIDSHEPGDLLEEVRSFARRRPGAFLFGALLAGVVVGRLTRGAVAAHRDDDGDTATSRPSPATLASDTGYSSGTGYAAGSGFGTGSDYGTGAGYGTGTTTASGAYGTGDFGSSTGSDTGVESGSSYGSGALDPDGSADDPLTSPSYDTGVTAAGGSRPVETDGLTDTDPLVDEPRRDLP